MEKLDIKKMLIGVIITILVALGFVKYNAAGEPVIVTEKKQEVVVESEATEVVELEGAK